MPSGRVKLAVDYLNGGVTLGQLLGLMEPPAFTADELTEALTALSELAACRRGRRAAAGPARSSDGGSPLPSPFSP